MDEVGNREPANRVQTKGRRTAEAALVANTAIWGSTFVLVKSALAGVSPLLFLTLRFSLAAVAIGVFFGARWVAVRRTWETSRSLCPVTRSLPVFWWAPSCSPVSRCKTAGLEYTTASKSAFLTATSSVMVPFLARIVYRTKPRPSEILGLLVATLGMGLTTLEGPLGVSSINRGDLLTLGCAVAFAAQIVVQGHVSGKMSLEWLSAVQVAVAALLAGSLFRWAESPRLEWRPAVVWAVVAAGLLATAVAFTIQAWARHFTTATRTALIYLLEPVFAWLASLSIGGRGSVAARGSRRGPHPGRSSAGGGESAGTSSPGMSYRLRGGRYNVTCQQPREE
ncbi:MAG TPA: DMT family transporter [Bryobacteraceae bacterium]|nr:DMT family transporter [Bryobacteraceae bacterium]